MNKFTFIDLFAGIGGLRQGFDKNGGHCVFTSEWNKFSQQTYKANFKDDHDIVGDITKVKASSIPDFDVLLAGFPCQPFSIAGVSKKNSLGLAHGFEDKTQGTLFFDVARIIKEKKPKAFLLENVKNLVSHDKGNTFKVICETLEKDLGYHVFHKIIDGSHFVPQSRQRIALVGFKSPTNFSFSNLVLPDKTHTMADVLHHENEDVQEPYTILDGDGKLIVNPKYTLSDKLWNYLQSHAKKHKQAGNGFGFGLVHPSSIARTLSARYYKDGSEILVHQQGKNPRRLTPRECARLMGFEDSFIIPVSDTQAYKQFGNSVIMPAFAELARVMVPHILSIK